jgi:VanZ family protein
LYHCGVPLKHWLPPVLWMAIIVTLSSDVASAEHTEHWFVPLLRFLASWATPTQIEAMHGLVRKGGHLTEYAVLASLWYRAFARGRPLSSRSAASVALAISLVWAVVDETRQSFVPSRTASVKDVALDGIGASLAMLVATLGWGTVIDRTTTLLLWTALLGGIAFLILNTLTDTPSGLLWLTPPLAAILLLARALYTRHHPRPNP